MTLADQTGLRVLTRVDGELDAGTYEALQPYEGDEPYFPDYVDSELPHDYGVSESIVEATKGHAIADEFGNIQARFEGERNGKSSLQRATEARASARVVFTADIQDLESDEPAESVEETTNG